MTYAKCDFVAGDEVFFEDNQANEKLGEFPSQWDLISGSVEMVKINGQECINFVEEDSKICPLMENSKSYLPEVFTLELDFWKPETSNSDRKDTR
ncbi:MAG: OmpA family protein, partial [Bacteroidales bacterium]